MGFLTRASEKPRPRSNMEAFAAAAAALLIGIGEDEAGLKLVLDVVHLAATTPSRSSSPTSVLQAKKARMSATV